MLNNPILTPAPTSGIAQPLLPNPLANQTPLYSTLRLNQMKNFEPVPEFIDDMNTKWSLVKAASNSTIDIPDPKTIQITDYWNHVFPGIKSEIYLYVVEGIKPARVETEKPMRVLYQWFSNRMVTAFNPQMITDREWLKANVYAAPLVNARIAKLYALCQVSAKQEAPAAEEELISIPEFNNAKPAERAES